LISQPPVTPAASSPAISGYTLFELIVVMALISITMVFAVPKVRDTIFVDNQRQLALWLTGEIAQLKKQTLMQKKIQILHLDIDQNRLWVTTADMPVDLQEKAQEKAAPFLEGTNLIAVEYPLAGKISSGTALIHFYPKGYSDNAIIHVATGDQTNLSFHIEPFLSTVPVYDDFLGFED
jgi:prepilin-type N-terminal cleavage/methylation domain-containing protein